MVILKKTKWVPDQKDNHLGVIVYLKEGIWSVEPAGIQKLNKLPDLASKLSSVCQKN